MALIAGSWTSPLAGMAALTGVMPPLHIQVGYFTCSVPMAGAADDTGLLMLVVRERDIA